MKKYDIHETRYAKRLHGAYLAPFGRRALALTADIAVASLLFVLVMLIAEPLIVSLGLMRKDEQLVFKFFGNWYSALWLALYFGISLYAGRGQTIGKRLLRVVSLTHERLSLFQSFERALGYGFSILELGFGFFQFFLNPNRRTVHDRVAETIVILNTSKRRGTRAGAVAPCSAKRRLSQTQGTRS